MAQILVLLGHSGNKRLLAKILADHELHGPQGEGIPNQAFDLIIADVGALVHWQDTLEAQREAQSPALIPVLLVARESQLGRARQTLDGQFEDVVVAPLRAPELIARIENMIRLRQSTLQLSQRASNSENALDNIDRAFRIFSACNELVIRAKTETELLNEMLGQLVGDEGYRFAWFGVAQHDEQHSVDVIAHCGGAAEFLQNIQLTWADNANGQGPAGRAIRSRQAEVSQNVQSDQNFAPWRHSVEVHGVMSVLALPLLIGEDTIAVLTLYSERPNAFSESEINLMHRLGRNIAHGMTALRDHQALDAEKERAEERAYRDALTNLPNRQWVLEELRSLEARSERHQSYAAVLFIDLDGFKRVNDGLGHEAGDRLLRMVADRLRQLVRDVDFVARQGGDEFIILMPLEPSPTSVDDHDKQEMDNSRAAVQVARRIIEGMGNAFEDGHNEHHLGVSIGISLFPHDSTKAADLVNFADKAMYRAKVRGGHDYHFYSEDITTQQRRQLELEAGLYRAVANESFALHYHPIIDIKTGQVDAVEALLRWPQDDGTLLSPADFIPLLEESGLIVRLGDWIIEQACHDLRKAREFAPELRMALNLSVRQLWQPTLTQQILRTVETQGLPPGALELEVTESSMMSDVPRMERMLHDFHDHGFTVAIDDFGTGYSSLARLAFLPVNTLKLDKSFLDDMYKSHMAEALVTTIVQMASNLDLNLVAEGIETDDQLQMLAGLKCPLGQGFLFTKPLPFEQLVGYLRATVNTASG